MHIGHINLAETFNGAGEHFVRLIESLRHSSRQQYVLVRNVALAKRLDLIDGITVGPVTRSSVVACCMMPAVDIVHIHDRTSASAGLLITLTRAVPFVMTRHVTLGKSLNPIAQAASNRAAGFIDRDQVDVETHLQVYDHAMATPHVPTLSL